MALTKYRLGDLIQLEDARNSDGRFSLADVRGISIQKVFIETKADMDGVSLSPYIIVRPDFFAYVTVTSRNGEKITLAHNNTEETYIVSSSYIVFSVAKKELLDSKYLCTLIVLNSIAMPGSILGDLRVRHSIGKISVT